MKTRKMAVILAMLLALAATGVVFLYVQNAKEHAQTGGEQVTVAVSKQDIPAGADLDPLIQDGAFTTKSVPRDDVIDGAVLDVAQLQGRTAAYPILAGEQVSTARLRGAAQAPGGLLGIPSGFQAVSVALDPQRRVGGAIQQDDHVTVYATLPDLSAASLGRALKTLTLVPDALVLRAEVVASSGSSTPDTLITLALRPRDAEMLVHATESGRVWLTLLPPNQKGVKQPPVTTAGLVG